MKNKFIIISLFLPLLLSACSTSQETSKSTDKSVTSAPSKDSLYVFDAVPPAEKKKPETQPQTEPAVNAPAPARMTMTYYMVQIGAFTTKEKADEFAAMSRKKLNYQVNVNFNPENNLYVVRLAQDFTSHDEAEKTRNEIWQISEFKDAWITSVQK